MLDGLQSPEYKALSTMHLEQRQRHVKKEYLYLPAANPYTFLLLLLCILTSNTLQSLV